MSEHLHSDGSTFGEKPQLISRARQDIAAACVDPVEFCSARLGFVPDAKQMEGLLSKAKRAIWNMARQSGKSTVAAAMALFRAWSQPSQLILFCSPSERQSAELLCKAETFVRRLGIAPKGGWRQPAFDSVPNGSGIVALPGTDGTVRGFSSVNLLVIDEASRVDDTLYKGLRPMLLVTELQDMERWEGGSGKVRMGAQGAGQHDDLVIALALACWRAGWKDIGGHEGPLF